eukprot:COSAG01_NODE_8755_length_2671_cov_267.949067_1_plen_34_part_10
MCTYLLTYTLPSTDKEIPLPPTPPATALGCYVDR